MTLSATSVKPTFDKARAEAFSETLAGFVNSGAVAAMISLGHKLSLFETMSRLPSSPSQVIAETAGLNERYVREWLAVMVTAGIVDYEPLRRTYRLPPEHAASMTPGAPLGNLAVYAQLVGLIGAIEDRLLERFREGGGLKYEDYPCFHAFMEQDSEQTITAQLFEVIVPMVDGLQARLEAGIDMLDAGCGRASALLALAKRFPNSRFTGYDLCEDAIAHARSRAKELGLSNLTLEARDLSTYDEAACFDLVTSFDAIHDQKDPQDLIHRLYAALRPGGVYLVQDVGGSAHLENNANFPMAPLLYAVSTAHCMPVSLGQDGVGLGTMWGWETAQTMLETAGFRPIEKRTLEHDPMNVWFLAQKG